MFEKLIQINCYSKNKIMRKLASEFLEKMYGCEIKCGQMGENINFAHHARGCTIIAAKICENVVIHQNVTIGTNLKFNKTSSQWENVGNPIISKNVVICDGAKILGPIIIGSDSIVAAGAIITKNIPADSIAYGVNQFRRKDPNLIFRGDMIDFEEIVEANRKRIAEFENLSMAHELST
jgi:serine O-acetyltransferase